MAAARLERLVAHDVIAGLLVRVRVIAQLGQVAVEVHEEVDEVLDELEQKSRQDFLDMVGYALLGRGTTVTTLPMQLLTGPKSVLETLRASGYTVEAPRL